MLLNNIDVITIFLWPFNAAPFFPYGAYHTAQLASNSYNYNWYSTKKKLVVLG